MPPTHLDVLIVDDDKQIGDAFQLHLEQYPIEVTFVSSVTSAISIIKKKKPKLAVIDLFLPDLDGFDLADEIYQYAPTCKIVLMSGIYDFNQAHLENIGFQDFLRKPIHFDELDRILRKYKIIE